ncbi:TonB-dependent receptor [Sphingomonas sp.]|uniref:TonB-dependent receptor n=1 Tax=Sphingomonas sp. TaxID=28214 RepID=UPI002ED88C84
MRKLGVRGIALLASAMPVVAFAQTAAQPQAQPQSAPQTPPDEEEEEAEIVVSGQLRGAVPGDIKPEAQLNPADIRAYGASNVSELLNALSAQLGASEGPPVVLLSGRRSSFGEVRNLPTEAIERIDILPEEAALRFGYSATQKVINFVLRRRFQAVTTVAEGVAPTAGGASGQGGNVNIQKINRGSRVEFDVKYGQNSGLLESERGVSRSTSALFDTRGNVTGFAGAEIDPALSAAAGTTVTVAGVPVGAEGSAPSLAGFAANANRPNVNDVSQYRTLGGGGNVRRFGDDLAPLSGSAVKNLAISGSYTPVISQKVSLNATLGFTQNSSESLQGLPSATLRLPVGNPFSPFTRDVQLLRYYDNLLPLSRSNDRRAINSEVNINGDTAPWLESWRWSAQASISRSDSESVSTTGIDPAPIQALLNARTPSFNPFGPLTGSAVLDRSPQTSQSTTNTAQIDLATYGSLFKLPAGDVNATFRVLGRTYDQQSRSSVAGVIRTGDLSRDSVSVRGNVSVPIAGRGFGSIGNLSINGNFEVQELSDFGRLISTGYGLNWAPIPQITAIVSIRNEERAPGEGQLGDPLILTPNARIYDFVRNESVDITAIRGGNPLLGGDSVREFNASLFFRPLDNLSIRTRYSSQRTLNPTSNFPGATAEIEAAFPGRFVRDPSGRLLSIDYRPVNFARSERSELRTTISFSKSIPSPQAQRLRERREAFQKAREESRRTGQPMPPEMTAMQEQFRRIGQQGSLFGNTAQRGQGQGQNQGRNPGDGPRGEGGARGGQGGGGGGGFRGGGGGGGGRGGFGGGNGGNQIRFELSHAWLINDETLIRPGLPTISRLDGTNGGSASPHQLDALAAVKRDAWLLQLTANWRSASQRTTGVLGSPTRLTTAPITRFGLLTEFNPGQDIDFLVKHPWFRGSRVQLRVDNLFDAKPRTTDANGVTPANYVPNLQDPIGRTVRLTFRKQFF